MIMIIIKIHKIKKIYFTGMNIGIIFFDNTQFNEMTTHALQTK